MSREELLQENTILKQKNAQLESKYKSLEAQLSQLLKLIHGFKSDRFVPEAINKE